MTRYLLIPLLSLALFGAEPYRQQPTLTTTERVDFASGGTVHINGSYGSLSVEGWDQPAVEVVVTRVRHGFYPEPERDRRAKKLDEIRVKAERRTATELTISTALSKRGWFARHAPATALGVDMEYRIRVPRATHVAIHHTGGTVLIADVSGEIEATSTTGDIVVMLPNPGPYAIDARTKVGTVYSDFDDISHAHWIGERSHISKPAPASRVYLRAGIGGISIQETNPGGY